MILNIISNQTIATGHSLTSIYLQRELITESKKVVLQVSSSANMLTTGLAAEKRQRGSGSRGHSPSKY